MPAIDFNVAQKKIQAAREILNKLDHVVALILRPAIYSNGNRTIELSEADKEKLELEYDEIMDELETAINEIPED